MHDRKNLRYSAELYTTSRALPREHFLPGFRNKGENQLGAIYSRSVYSVNSKIHCRPELPLIPGIGVGDVRETPSQPGGSYFFNISRLISDLRLTLIGDLAPSSF